MKNWKEKKILNSPAIYPYTHPYALEVRVLWVTDEVKGVDSNFHIYSKKTVFLHIYVVGSISSVHLQATDQTFTQEES